ncbi:MAG: mechanosensitive ion channel [Lewinellaceae bacterium]|nr:mechanosensitive ion channel [Lewinellaceae bacterium]
MFEFITQFQETLLTYSNWLGANLPRLGLALFIFIASLWFGRRLKRVAHYFVKQKGADALLGMFLGKALQILLLIIGIILILNLMGLTRTATQVVAGAGITAFIIGFAFKDIGENLLAGVMLAFKRPFRVGDVIQTMDIKGKIMHLSLRETIIKTFDGRDVYVPNSVILKNPLFNFTMDGFIRSDFVIGVEYRTDLDLAIRTIKEVLPEIKGILQEERPPTVVVDDIKASTVAIKVYFGCTPTNTPKVSRKFAPGQLPW